MKYILSLIAAISMSVTAADKEFKPLFNGKDLTGWQGMGGPMTNWEVKEGVLSCTGKGGSAWIATQEEYANFELKLEYNIPENGNSGVFIRAPKNGAPWVAGLEIQVLDDYGSKWKNLKPVQFTGSIYAVQAPSSRVTKKAGEWQSMRIRCNGNQCCVWVNGTCVIDAKLDVLAAKSKNVTGLKRTKGFIGLQNHASPVHFRNIQIKRLK
tara:strand:+ start:136 stop:765 length:630 start_codon:yes stop_codon:yes gene_type:complete